MLYSENRLDPKSAEEPTLASTGDTPSKLGGASSNRTTAGTVMSDRGGDNRTRGAAGKTAAFGCAPAAADAAFAKLVKARDRAVCSTWGGVALAGRGALAACGAVSGGDSAEARGDTSAWAMSARAASLACNGMVRRVCEAQRRDTDFGHAWEAAVSAIIQDVLAPDPNDNNAGPISQGTPAPGSAHPESLPSCQDRATTLTVVNEHPWREEFDRVRTYHPSARWLQD